MHKRLALYIKEMFPLLPRLLFALLWFYSLYFLVTMFYGHQSIVITGNTITGFLTIFFFLLFIRICDELKDYETDKKFFPDRPLPSGKVKISDLWVLLGVVTGLMFLLNVVWHYGIVAFTVLFIYGLLMFKYFFIPKIISKNLILALITHNPITLFVNFYVITIFCTYYRKSVFTLSTIRLAILFWLPILAWELSRKIRAPRDENEYMTYSRKFGYKIAALLPIIVMGIHFFLLMYLVRIIGISLIFMVVVTILYAGFIVMFIRFILTPTSKTARLKTVTEIYTLLVMLALIIEVMLTRTVVIL